jgi:hypothetical protein
VAKIYSSIGEVSMDIEKAKYEVPQLEQQGRYSVITGSCPPGIPNCGGGESLPFFGDFMDSSKDFMDGARE